MHWDCCAEGYTLNSFFLLPQPLLSPSLLFGLSNFLIIFGLKPPILVECSVFDCVLKTFLLRLKLYLYNIFLFWFSALGATWISCSSMLQLYKVSRFSLFCFLLFSDLSWCRQYYLDLGRMLIPGPALMPAMYFELEKEVCLDCWTSSLSSLIYIFKELTSLFLFCSSSLIFFCWFHISFCSSRICLFSSFSLRFS